MRCFAVFLCLLPALYAQAPPAGDWGTRTIQLRYIDPDELREVYSGRSFVMQVNRDLKLLTVNGPTQFLNEVEEMGRKLDVPPAAPADIEITIYLLSNDGAAQSLPVASSSSAIEAALSKLGPRPAGSLGIVDLRTLRVEEGQGADVRLNSSGAAGASFGRVAVQSAAVVSGGKPEIVRLSGLRIWIAQPSAAINPDSDFVANVDVKDGQPQIVVRSGASKQTIVFIEVHVRR